METGKRETGKGETGTKSAVKAAKSKSKRIAWLETLRSIRELPEVGKVAAHT